MEKYAYLIGTDYSVKKVAPGDGRFFHIEELWSYCGGAVDIIVPAPGLRAIFSPTAGGDYNTLASTLLDNQIGGPVLIYKGYKSCFDAVMFLNQRILNAECYG